MQIIIIINHYSQLLASRSRQPTHLDISVRANCGQHSFKFCGILILSKIYIINMWQRCYTETSLVMPHKFRDNAHVRRSKTQQISTFLVTNYLFNNRYFQIIIINDYKKATLLFDHVRTFLVIDSAQLHHQSCTVDYYYYYYCCCCCCCCYYYYFFFSARQHEACRLRN